MSYLRASQHLQGFRSRLEREINRGVEKSAEAGLREAKRRSSGSRTTAELRRRDHPYATRHGKPKLDPSTINVQTGSFRSAWKIQSANRADEGFAVVNFSEVAGYLREGTPKMFARPIEDRVLAYVGKVSPKYIEAAINRATQ